MDYDEFRTGMRREALYSNIMQFFNWYMSMFSTSAPFLVLQLLGFEADQMQTVTTT
jgi:Na+/melibiose symporter-like transporter